MRRLLVLLRQFGFDPIVFANAVKNTPRFICESVKFFQLGGRFSVFPELQNYKESAGVADGHYFWQDLICAQWIFERSAKNHLDVGSRVDGFIAHLLSFRKVTLLDVRPLDTRIPNLEFQLGNAQIAMLELREKFASVSTLHALEHFGLGRYGDVLDVKGHESGLRNISEIVAKNGHLYVSFPIGNNAVHFNSQRVLDPNWVVDVLKDFELEEFVLIPWKGFPQYLNFIPEIDSIPAGSAGLYRFRRVGKLNGT